MSNEQMLVDLCFELAMKIRMGHPDLKNNDECGQWVAKELREHGFNTKPCATRWGVLVDKNGEFIK